MGGAKYRITLYGHVSSDADQFFQHLAMILGHDEDYVRDLMNRLPAVIKEGLEKETAESLMEALKLIRALCIMEITEGGAVHADSTAYVAAEEPAPRIKKDKAAFSWARWSVAIGVTALIVSLLAMTLMISVRERSAGPSVTIPREPQWISRRGAADDTLEYDREEIEAMLVELEAENKELQFELKELRKSLDAVYNRYPPPKHDQLREQKRSVMAHRARIQKNARKIRQLQQRMMTLALKERKGQNRGTRPMPSADVTPAPEK